MRLILVTMFGPASVVARDHLGGFVTHLLGNK